MKLIWILAAAGGAMSTTVDEDGWVTQTATVPSEACVLIVCDCNKTQVRPGGESEAIEVRYRKDDPREATFPFVYERQKSLFIVRQEYADFSDDEFAIEELQVRIGKGYAVMLPGNRPLQETNHDLYGKRCRLSQEAVREAEARAKAEAEAPRI